MLGSLYQKLAMRTNDKLSTKRLVDLMLKIENAKHEKECFEPIDVGGILNGCLGLSGEVGEFNDLVKKMIFHEKKVEQEHLKKELGDCCWYLAMICQSFGWDMDEIMQMNVDKLKARYPEGFDVERANNKAKDDV